MRPSDGEITDPSLGRLAGLRSGPSRRFLIGAAGASLVAPVIRPRRGGHAPAAERHMSIALLSDDRLLASPPQPLAALPAHQSQALTPLFAGLAGRLTARCNIVCIGDSITEGQGAEGPPSSGFENRWLARLRDQLRSRFPTQGLTGGGRGFIGVAGTGELSFAWPATTSQPLGAGIAGPKAEFLQLASTGESITFNLVGDSADIMWMQVPFGGTFSWAVDGGPATSVSTNGSPIVDGKLTHIALGAPGSHTLVLSWVSGLSNIDGVIEYDGDYSSGIQTHDAGHYGYETSSWVSALRGGAAEGSAAAIAALAPAAMIITLGVNDQYAGVAPATFESRLHTIISDLKARLPKPYPTFLLNMLPPRYDQKSFKYPWSLYITAAEKVASSDRSGPGRTSIVAVFDYAGTPYMPGADADVYGFWQAGDLVHPSNKGHQRIGDCLIEFLTMN
jgi:lysophospholipase L1-like esterase